MASGNNWRRMTVQQIADFVEKNISEFGEYDVTSFDIMSKVDRLEIIRFQHGFSIVIDPRTENQNLWFVYVDREHRGCGLGRKYVRATVKAVCGVYGIVLHCGPKLVEFYESCEFGEVSRDKGSVRMVFPDDGYCGRR